MKDLESQQKDLIWFRLGPWITVVGLVALAVAAFRPEWQVVGVALAFVLAPLIGFAWARSAQHAEVLSRAAEESRRRVLEMERENEQQRTLLASLADGLDTLVFLCGAEAQVLYANRAARRAFRITARPRVTLLAATMSPETESLARDALRLGEPQTAEITFRHPEERIGWVQAWPEPSGNPSVFVAIIDVTELRRLERVRTDFVANVSHELRTPLTTMRIMAETLQESSAGDSELSGRYLAKIISEVDRLAKITDELLTLTTTESSQIQKEPLNLAELVGSVVQTLLPKAKEKGLELECRCPDVLELQGSHYLLTQVIVNLVDNAISYTLHGRIEVELEGRDNSALLTVRDTGIGIGSEHKQRIFERFYRVDKGRSRAGGGTGLGLSICRHIVEQHGGRIEVQSELNKGSQFTVELPYA